MQNPATTLPSSAPVRDETGTIIGAIARSPGGGWDPYTLTPDRTGYMPVGYGWQTTPTPTEAARLVRSEHALLVRIGDR